MSAVSNVHLTFVQFVRRCTDAFKSNAISVGRQITCFDLDETSVLISEMKFSLSVA